MINKILLILGLTLIISSASSFADQVIEFGPENTEITGSIKYTVVGRYHATFEEFQGKVIYDDKNSIITNVDLFIEAGTIKSRFETLDKIVRSKQVLDVEGFPEIKFKSQMITKTEEGYMATGNLTLHGVTKEMTFPFSFEVKQENGKDILNATGKWVIPRKEFGVIWNRLLDKGGILVGNHITVEWLINAKPKEMNR